MNTERYLGDRLLGRFQIDFAVPNRDRFAVNPRLDSPRFDVEFHAMQPGRRFETVPADAVLLFGRDIVDELTGLREPPQTGNIGVPHGRFRIFKQGVGRGRLVGGGTTFSSTVLQPFLSGTATRTSSVRRSEIESTSMPLTQAIR